MKGQLVEIGLKLTAKKGHIGSAFGKMLQNIVEEPETGKEHLNPYSKMSFYISSVHTVRIILMLVLYFDSEIRPAFLSAFNDNCSLMIRHNCKHKYFVYECK